MSVKSIVDFEIDPQGNFAKFTAQWDRYQKLLKDSPKEWAKVTDGIGRSRKEFDQLVKQQLASIGRARLVADAEKEALRLATTMGDRWREIARNTRSAASSIKDATTSLLKWTALTSVISGVLGAGGLFGIDRLAGSVAAGRRSSLGLGASYGQQRSFGVNFGRLVDPDSFLGSVAGAQSDVTRRVGFYGAGLGERQIQGSTADVGVELLRALKKIADQTDPKLYAQVIGARQLGQFVTTEDLRRLAATSGQEFEQLVGGYRRNVGGLDLSSQTQKAWQDLSTQLTRAGNQIENTFVKGLLPLVPGIERLSVGVEKTIRAFLGSDTVKKWMDQLGEGLEKFAGYIATPEFERNITTFVAGIGDLGKAIGGFVTWFSANAPKGAQTGGLLGEREGHDTWNDMLRGSRSIRNWSGWTAPNHNPGNLRAPGQPTGFQSFASDDDGIRAMARQLRLYQNRDNLNTVRGIVSKYAPSSENDTAAYVAAVGKRTGFGADDPINLNDSGTLSKLISAMTKQENSKSNFTPGGVKVVIENATGGNSIVTTNQLQGQQ